MRSAVSAAVLLLALVLAGPAAAKSPKKTFAAGAATASTDPVDGTRLCLGGYGSCADGAGRTMTGIGDPMLARAFAISSGRRGMILVHTTNIGLFAAYKTPGLGIYHLRQEVAERTGVPASSVLVQADHSHSAPDTIGIWGGVPVAWLRRLQAQAVEAAVEAWERREPARVFVGTAEGAGVTSSYREEPNLATDDEFRLLWAEGRRSRERILTWSNYSPHATVQKSSNTLATGDWPEWASQLAEKRFGGTGVAGVGTLGREDFGARGSNDAERKADAIARLDRMMTVATASATEVPPRGGVRVRSVFIREAIAQPVLLANLIPEGTIDAGGYDVSIDRSIEAPWNTGATIGTYAGAARIGDVFVGVAPGESFPQIQFYLRDEQGITGARAFFHLGATNDFLGYMVRPVDDYVQTFREGALYLAGCPEEAFLEGGGLEYDRACPDHWTLMVSPTIGTHVACTIQDAGEALGFTVGRRDDACAPATATDGVGAPAETNG